MNKQPNTILDDATLKARKTLVTKLYRQLFESVESNAEISGYTKLSVLIGVAQMIIHEILVIVGEARGVTVARAVADNLKRFIDDCSPTLN